MKRILYVNEDSTVFVEFWVEEGQEPDGPPPKMYVAQRRDPSCLWLPPQEVTREEGQ